MTAWLLALAIAALLAALAYVPPPRAHPAVAALALLRAAAVLLLAALALDVPLGRTQVAAPIVALDASASWTRGGDAAALGAAADSARRLAADTLWLTGDTLRPRAGRGAPERTELTDARSRVGALADRAAAAGRPLLLVTDGEIEDVESLTRAPRGSRVLVVPPARGPDAAALALTLPPSGSERDTLVAEVLIGADTRGADVGTVRLLLDGREVAQAPLPALAPYAEQAVRLRVPLAGRAGLLIARAVVQASGDREPRNDTVAVSLEVSDVPAVVFVSSAPDFDARAAIGVVRGALGLPVRAFYRVAPGAWRREETLAPVEESVVRSAARDAGLLILHGDTAVFGPPRALGRGALALAAPPRAATAEGAAEWYATAAPPSPIAPALSSVAWDSLPPLDVDGAAPRGDWIGLEARVGRQGGARAVVTGVDAPRRVAVVGAGGLWRWQFRGGAAGEAFSALWGGILDWLAAGRGDRRAAVPEGGLLRAGDPVTWRRGGADSTAALVLARRGATAGPESLTVRFAAGERTARSPALLAGVYDVRGPGGVSVLAVSAARELLPRRATIRSGAVGGGATADRAPRLREAWWAYVLPLLLLSGEWMARRRLGLR
jgi:hypothetical protein